MDEVVKSLFDKIPKNPRSKDAAQLLLENCDKIKHHFLSIMSTTTDRDNELKYIDLYGPFIHTFNKEVQYAKDSHSDWMNDNTLKGWESFELHYERAYQLIDWNLTQLTS